MAHTGDKPWETQGQLSGHTPRDGNMSSQHKKGLGFSIQMYKTRLTFDFDSKFSEFQKQF